MVNVLKNKRSRTNTVCESVSGVSVKYDVPLPRSNQKSTLVISSGNRRVKLNGRQLRVLRRVLFTGKLLAK